MKEIFGFNPLFHLKKIAFFYNFCTKLTFIKSTPSQN